MRAYIELILSDLRLAMRDKTVIFFNYMFPLLFFFVFAELFKVRENGTISYVVSMVLVLGVLGNGLWGAGMRVVIEREQHILRRFKVAPISASPILVASMVTGWILYLPAIAIIMGVAIFWYGMQMPARPLSLLFVVTMGLIAFRAIGLILASVANSMQEVNILIQLIYMPMLFLTGSLFPLTMLPDWIQTLAQFLPATYLSTSIKAVFLQNATVFQNATAMFALLLTAILGTFMSVKLFRWEKEDKVPFRSKLWVLAVLAPFIILGAFQIQSRDQIRKARMLDRSLERQQTVLIRGARIFVGDGQIVESGSVLIRGGKIEQVFGSNQALPARIEATTVEAAGKTLLPGLIDAHVHLSGPAAIPDARSSAAFGDPGRNLAAFLYSGVIAIRSVGDPLFAAMTLKQEVESGERLGAELFTSGPMFTAPGGHGTEYFVRLPEMMRKNLEAETLRLPRDAEEARRQVRDLKAKGVDFIKVTLDEGEPGRSFPKLDFAIFRAIGEEARRSRLALAVHTGASVDIEQAIQAKATSIEHGSAREHLDPGLFDRIKAGRIFYVPTLAVLDSFGHISDPSSDMFNRTLVQQVVPKALLESTQRALRSSELKGAIDSARESGRQGMTIAIENLLEAYRAGVALAAGSDAGNLLVFHGPAIHRELQLWVEAGIPVSVALQAATSNAARLLGIGDRVGLIKPGYEASLILVDGNPLEDISTTERISMVIFKGERINRSGLFEQQ